MCCHFPTTDDTLWTGSSICILHKRVREFFVFCFVFFFNLKQEIMFLPRYNFLMPSQSSTIICRKSRISKTKRTHGISVLTKLTHCLVKAFTFFIPKISLSISWDTWCSFPIILWLLLYHLLISIEPAFFSCSHTSRLNTKACSSEKPSMAALWRVALLLPWSGPPGSL